MSNPSLLSNGTAEHSTEDAGFQEKQKFIYITAILNAGTPKIDGVALGAPGGGPVSFFYPIKCRSFQPDSEKQIAYYIQ